MYFSIKSIGYLKIFKFDDNDDPNYKEQLISLLKTNPEIISKDLEKLSWTGNEVCVYGSDIIFISNEDIIFIDQSKDNLIKRGHKYHKDLINNISKLTEELNLYNIENDSQDLS